MNETKEHDSAEEVPDRLSRPVRTDRRFSREGKLKVRWVGKQCRVTASHLHASEGASERAGSAAPANRRRVLVATTVVSCRPCEAPPLVLLHGRRSDMKFDNAPRVFREADGNAA